MRARIAAMCFVAMSVSACTNESGGLRMRGHVTADDGFNHAQMYVEDWTRVADVDLNENQAGLLFAGTCIADADGVTRADLTNRYHRQSYSPFGFLFHAVKSPSPGWPAVVVYSVPDIDTTAVIQVFECDLDSTQSAEGHFVIDQTCVEHDAGTSIRIALELDGCHEPSAAEQGDLGGLAN